MNGYKRIFRSAKLRQKILRFLVFVPDKWMLSIQYKIKLGRWPNLKNPERFTEKLQCYKMYYRNPILSQCVDKYAVRDYIKSKNLDYILNKIYGVYNDVDEIDFSSLPDQFVIKTTNGGGGLNIIICRDKTKFDINSAKKKLGEWKRKINAKDGGREWAYDGIEPKIIVEEYLENKEAPDSGINDYKFFCFNGKPYYLAVDVNRYVNHRRNFYDNEWRFLNVYSDKDNCGDIIPKPNGFEEMLDIAAKLSKGFPFVRVDLYCNQGVIRFGELTFYPWSGYVQFYPDDFDFELGKRFNFNR